MRHSLVICTRNRSDELAKTLESIKNLRNISDCSVLIVDASDDESVRTNNQSAHETGIQRIKHFRFEGQPSLARQRNFAIDEVAQSVDVIHFLDDDVTLDPEYLHYMEIAFRDFPDAGGIGATVIEKGRSERPPKLARLMSIFLLYSKQPGRVLVSGHETPAQSRSLDSPLKVQWLNGCAAYRTHVFDENRFEAILEGYSLDEDLDLSYRVGLSHPLYVYPLASMIHRRSSENRYPEAQYFEDYLIHRYWFVEKNLASFLSKIAFWWSTVGRLLRAVAGPKPVRSAMLSGYLRGIRRIARRDHYLLDGVKEK